MIRKPFLMMVILSAPLIDALQSVPQRGVEPRHNIAENDRVIFRKFRQQHHIYYYLLTLRVCRDWLAACSKNVGKYSNDISWTIY